jgi:hypothetical protein
MLQFSQIQSKFYQSEHNQSNRQEVSVRPSVELLDPLDTKFRNHAIASHCGTKLKYFDYSYQYSIYFYVEAIHELPLHKNKRLRIY